MNRISILIALLLVFAIPLAVSNDLRIDGEVFDELAQEDTVDVIVVLEDDASVSVDDTAVEIRDSDWMSRDDRISAEEISITEEYSAALNGFAAEVTEAGLELLEDSANVDRIYYDQTYTLALENSVPQVNADDVHGLQLNGVDLTGAGQTICVIDTGINYNHNSLGSGFGAGYKVISGENIYNSSVPDPLDDHGHGSHVAGIAAASGDITGIAPGANLIAMKVFGATRSTTASKVLAGIDWCVNNATEFNISVITMSLSLTSYGDEVIFTSSSTCDNYGDGGVVNASNNAASQGILVSAAAGNDGNTTGIGSPACGSNVTSVGAVNNADTLSYNRGPILDLLAPGVLVNSTYTSDDYVQMSGTSMATPHVAGAAAILWQIADLEGATVTAQQVENALKENAERVYDASSNFTYSRIDLLSAANFFIYPNLTYTGALVDGASVGLNTTILSFSATDISEIDTVWYSNGTDDFFDMYTNTSGLYYVDAYWPAGEYNLTFYANDSLNNVANVTFNIVISSAPVIGDWAWYNSTATSVNATTILIDENNSLSILINVTDSDSDTLTYNWTIDGVTVSTIQDLSYDFDVNSQGNRALLFVVMDEVNQSVTQSWTVTVGDHVAPRWNATIPDTDADEEVAWEYNVSDYVSSLDNDTLIYSVSSGYSISSSGTISRTFDCDDDGEYTVTVTVSDGINPASTTFSVDVQDTESCSSSGDDDEGGDFDDGQQSGGMGDTDDTDDNTTTTNTTTASDTTTSNTSTEETYTLTNDTADEAEEGGVFSRGLSGATFSGLNFDFGENEQYVAPSVAMAIAFCLYGVYHRSNSRKGKKVKFEISSASFKRYWHRR